MSAEATNLNVHGGGARESIARYVTNFSRFKIRRVMESNRIIGPGKSRIQAILQHRSRAVNRLLRRLANKHERSAPLIFQLRQHFRGAKHARDVNVMPAGVHYADVLS